MRSAYVDASAVVKLFKPEAESVALRTALAEFSVLLSTELLAVEARCAARRVDATLLRDLEEVLATVEALPCTAAIRRRAGGAFSEPLRALDAIHAATALSVRDDLEAVFVYDAALGRALAHEGLTVAGPGVPA